MENKNSYERAKVKVEGQIKFIKHLVVYLIVNVMLITINFLASPETLWFFWPLVGWGVALILHGLSIYSGGRLFADWEEKKIRELMEEEVNN